jgi:integrase
MTVERDQWDDNRKRPFNDKVYAELLTLEKKIRDIFNYLSLRGEITPDILKLELDEKLKGKANDKVVRKVRIVDFINQEVKSLTRLKDSSKKAYNNLANKLIDFENKIGRHLYSNDVNDEIYLQFVEDLRLRLNKQNAVWSVLKTFKATLNQIARKYKIVVFSPARELSSADKVSTVAVDAIYLTFDDIKTIINHSPKSPSKANVKLILLTLLFTGCRESDVYKIKPDNLYEKNGDSFYYAHYFSEKTDTEIVVPILKPLADAFEANDGKPAYPIAQQKFNTYVKELIADCGLTHEVTLSHTDSTGKKQFEKRPFNEFVTSHIGRRSFVSNLIKHVPITSLTKITGHTLKDKSIIFGYDKTTHLEYAVIFRDQLRYAMERFPEYFPIELL